MDAFRFETPDGGTALRAPVELNARFTVGTVVVGLLRRHLAEVTSRLGLAPGERRAFSFLLDTEAPARIPPDAIFLPLGDTEARRGPGLLIARDEALLEDVLARGDAVLEGKLAGADAEPEGALPGRS